MNEPLNGFCNELSYEQFGQQFIHSLVTPERIERELRALLAEPINGTMSKLPVELLTAKYSFTLQDAQISRRPECLPQLGLRQRISGLIALTVNLLGLNLRFTLRVIIHLEQIVRVYEPLFLRIETRSLDANSVELQVDPHDLPGEILDRLTIIERAVRAEVLEEVNRRLLRGTIAEALTINLGRIAEEAKLASSPAGA